MPGINELVDARASAHRERHQGVCARCRRCARTATMRPRAPQFEAHKARSRLCAAAEARAWTIPRAATPAEIDAGRRQHDPERAGAVLVVPHHGRLRVLLHRAVRVSRSGCRAGASSTAIAGICKARAVEPAAAVARDRARLDRRRIRPPAVGDRRRAADRARRVVGHRAAQVATSLAGFVLFYSALAVVDAMLMVKYVRKGPDGLGMLAGAGHDGRLPTHRATRSHRA